MVGQTLSALAQVFLLVAPTKLAALWFAANERVEANMIATMSEFLALWIYFYKPFLKIVNWKAFFLCYLLQFI